MVKSLNCANAALAAVAASAMGATSSSSPLDIALLIDQSYSAYKSVSAIAKNLTDIVDFVSSNFSDARLSIALFTDKPVAPLGYQSEDYEDFCYKAAAPFGASDGDLKSALDNVVESGGNDFHDAQADALIRALVGSDWRSGARKVVVLATHSLPHANGDLENVLGSSTEAGPLTSSDLADDMNAKCGKIEYPSDEMLKKAFVDVGDVALVFLLAPAARPCADLDKGICAFPELEEEVSRVGRAADASSGMTTYYTQWAKSLGLSNTAVRSVDVNYKGFSAKFEDAVYAVGTADEGSVSSTEEPPTSASSAITTTGTASTLFSFKTVSHPEGDTTGTQPPAGMSSGARESSTPTYSSTVSTSEAGAFPTDTATYEQSACTTSLPSESSEEFTTTLDLVETTQSSFAPVSSSGADNDTLPPHSGLSTPSNVTSAICEPSPCNAEVVIEVNVNVATP